jgi:hypothetical protein
MTKRLILLASLRAGLAAHPMGNFSVNHYARLEPGAHGVAIRYVMDLAEGAGNMQVARITADLRVDAAATCRNSSYYRWPRPR